MVLCLDNASLTLGDMTLVSYGIIISFSTEIFTCLHTNTERHSI